MKSIVIGHFFARRRRNFLPAAFSLVILRYISRNLSFSSAVRFGRETLSLTKNIKNSFLNACRCNFLPAAFSKPVIGNWSLVIGHFFARRRRNFLPAAFSKPVIGNWSLVIGHFFARRRRNFFPAAFSKPVIGNWSLVIIIATMLLVSCKDSKHPGYTEAEPGIYYKLHIPGESGKKATEEDFYEVRMQNKYNGVVFFDSEFQNASGTLFMQSSASRYFSVLGEGDSATFLLPGGDLSLPGMPDTGMVEMNVKIIRILTADQVQQLEKSADPDLNEQVLIKRYLAKNKLSSTPDSSGLYYIVEKEGTGAQPAYGKTVSVIYSGKLPNGKPIDGNAEAGTPFSFPYGAEGQVIPGIMKALSYMKAGGKAKIILPSPLAFGVNGSSTGIVPPHTPVIYELELVSVE